MDAGGLKGMLLKRCIFVIFLLTFFQNPVFSNSSEEIVFYEQLLDSYESNNMKKFYSLLSKFEKIYPDSKYKEALFTLAAKNLYESKQYANALFFIEQLDNPSRLKSYQSECYLRLKNYNKVISLYRNAAPKDLISKQILASAFIGIANDKTENPQKRAEAASYAIEVLESQRLESMPEDTLLALSKLHFRSNQFQKSAEILQHLINSSASNKEELLIHLSLVQKKYNYALAVKTLDEALKINGDLKDVAAYHKMMVLFENKQYKALISSRDSLKSHLGQENLPLLNYYLGVAFLSNNEYSEAEKEFKSYLENPADYENLKLFAIETLKTIIDRKRESLPNNTLFELANLYFQSNQYEKGARVLKEVFESNPSNKEAVLLQLSLAQKNFSPNSALKELEEVIKFDNVNKQTAAYRKMLALFQSRKYSNLISYKERLQENLNPNDLPLLHYFLGIAFLKNNEYMESEKAFNIYLSDTKEHEDLKLDALNYLRKIAKKKNDITLLNNVEASILSLASERQTNLIKNTAFKNNNKIDLSTALALKRKKKFNEAEKILKTLLKSEKTQEKSSIHFELAHIYYLDAKYLKAKNLFMSFIKRNPNSALVPLAWNHYIESSIELAQNSDNKYAKAQLMHDTRICLKNNKYLSQLERVELMFLLAKTQYELSSFEEAIETINTLIKSKRIESDVLAKCYLILGYSYKNGLGDNESFILYIKKATKVDPSLLSNKKIQAVLEGFSKDKIKDIQVLAN